MDDKEKYENWKKKEIKCITWPLSNYYRSIFGIGLFEGGLPYIGGSY